MASSEIVPSLAFPVASFYGTGTKTSDKRTKNLSRKGRNYSQLINSQLRVPKPFPGRLFGPRVCWRTFYRQQEAFDFADQTSEDLCVFAFECGSNGGTGNQTGQRRYLVTSLQQFWHHYSDLLPHHRHHYEVIREGRICKLFFDLEYMIKLNPHCDGNGMVDILIKYVCLWLQEIFGISCNRSDVLDMDASTTKKFSRHLVFQLDHLAFENCVVAGYFVRHIFTVLVQYLRLKTRQATTETQPLSREQDVNRKSERTQRSPSKKMRKYRPVNQQYSYSSDSHFIPDFPPWERKTKQTQKTQIEFNQAKAFCGTYNCFNNEERSCKTREQLQHFPSLNSPLSSLKKKIVLSETKVELGPIDNGADLDEVVRSFQESSDEEELSFLSENYERYSKEDGNSDSQFSTTIDSCDEEELSLLAELCEQETETGVAAVTKKLGESEDDYKRELVLSMEEWEEINAAENRALNDLDCDDRELVALLDEYEKQADADTQGLTCEDCDDAELVFLAQACEEEVGSNYPESVRGKTDCRNVESRIFIHQHSGRFRREETCINPAVENPFDNLLLKTRQENIKFTLDNEELSQIAELLDRSLEDDLTMCASITNKKSCEGSGTRISSSRYPSERTTDDNHLPSDTKENHCQIVNGSHIETVVEQMAKFFGGEEIQEQENEAREECIVVNDGMEKICSHFSLEELRSLFVHDKDGKEQLFCDLGVYTKNRNFRLYMSSKLNKNNPLIMASQNQYHPPEGQINPQSSYEKSIFMASLVSVFDTSIEDMKILQFGPDVSHSCLTRSNSGLSVKNSEVKAENTRRDEYKEGHAASPFPPVDAFILSLVSGGEKQGRIRMWRHTPGQDTITYYITGYRWCSNIGREHRSNNIFYTVDLTHWKYTQGCYDVDCRHAQRESKKIPQRFCPDQAM